MNVYLHLTFALGCKQCMFFRFQEIVVRVLFILGNLTTKSDETRHNLYFTKASTKYLLTVFRAYFERNIEVRYASYRYIVVL